MALILLVLSFLGACGPEPEKAPGSNPPEAADAPFPAETAPSITESPVDEKPTWEKCTVRAINYLYGTEFTVLHSDGSYSVYGTPAICSLPAFIEGRCPVDEIKSDTLSHEELDRLRDLLSFLYRDGEMLPIEENWEDYFEFEASYVYVSADDSEEAFFLKGRREWDDYPPKEYDELIRLVHSLYPQSVVLHDKPENK